MSSVIHMLFIRLCLERAEQSWYFDNPNDVSICLCCRMPNGFDLAMWLPRSAQGFFYQGIRKSDRVPDMAPTDEAEFLARLEQDAHEVSFTLGAEEARVTTVTEVLTGRNLYKEGKGCTCPAGMVGGDIHTPNCGVWKERDEKTH